MNRLLIGLILLFVVSLNTSAKLIDNNTFTTDTESGLDWLDVTSSVNLSFEYVSSQLSTGGEFEGWSYATNDQFKTLASNYFATTLITEGSKYFTTDDSLVDDLVLLFGNTIDTWTQEDYGQTYAELTGLSPDVVMTYTIGFLDNSYKSETDRRWYAGLFDVNEGQSGNDYFDTYIGDIDNNITNYSIGSFLVRSTTNAVPEPSTIHLIFIGFGFFSLFFLRHKLSQSKLNISTDV